MIRLTIVREVAKESERLVGEGSRRKNRVCNKLLGLPQVSLSLLFVFDEHSLANLFPSHVFTSYTIFNGKY